MKIRLVTVLALAVLTCSLHAQTKIATINLKKAFDEYWRTKVSSAELQETTAEAEQDLRKLIERYQKANEAFRQLVEKVNDSATSNEEREKLKTKGQVQANDLKEMEREINDFLQGSRARIGNKQQRLRATLLGEINIVITTKAKAGGYDLVLDTSGETGNNTPTVQYTNGKNDLTDAVLAELNANAPADLPKSSIGPEAKPDAKPEEKKKP
ncbi:MAG: OmpH family outer membrane protein [Verrucomicrobiota bacterium]